MREVKEVEEKMDSETLAKLVQKLAESGVVSTDGVPLIEVCKSMRVSSV